MARNVLSTENITELLRQAAEIVSKEDVWQEAQRMVNIEALLEASSDGTLTLDEVGKKFTWAGFLIGIQMALENLQIEDETEPEAGK